MRVRKAVSRGCEHYAIIQDINVNGKRTTKIYENLGNFNKIKARAGDEEPMVWLKKYVDNINKKHKEEALPVTITKYTGVWHFVI